MFDPTIYDNVKIVLEGAVYDMDMNGTILVSRRVDQIDLSSMSRYYAIGFQEMAKLENTAEICLTAHLKDLAAEILEHPNESPGCYLGIRFFTKITDPQQECPLIQNRLLEIWGHRPRVTQQLSYLFNEQPFGEYSNQIELHFGRKIDEEQMEDFPELVQHTIASLAWLNIRKAK
jgi:hypothetical protein